ncbi:MAG TPA: DUF5996 family protein [Terriglobia bacterium]|nr:DUF5996 family protein [Terriglobia bacterium]
MSHFEKSTNNSRQSSSSGEFWPALPLAEWEDTYHTLHMWTQIAGKVRLDLAPLQNHWWNSALYVNTRGLTTSPIPYQSEAFEIQFDFVNHRLEILTSFGRDQSLALEPKSVEEFYHEFLSALRAAGIEIIIDPKPQEVPEPIPFDQDETHRSYDAEYANRLWRILLSTTMVLEEFRARYMGKASPVHFFWGSFDLAYTRFSGRVAPPRKGIITSEAYSHECSSVGWWPGGGAVKGPAFYAYAAPQPEGYDGQVVRPGSAYYDGQLHEFILMYDDVRSAPSPRDAILEFAESAYEAGANLGKWDRNLLERR